MRHGSHRRTRNCEVREEHDQARQKIHGGAGEDLVRPAAHQRIHADLHRNHNAGQKSAQYAKKREHIATIATVVSMPFTQRKPKNESEAVKKLVDDINQIDEDKNKVGRIVLAVFAFVFLAAATLLGVLITSQ